MEVQDAVRRSISAFGDIFPAAAREDLRLEEVSLNDEESEWITTVSFPNPDYSDVEISRPAPNSLAEMLGHSTSGPSRRLYKEIHLRSVDGKLLGILNTK